MYHWMLELKTQLILLVAQDENRCPNDKIIVTGDAKTKAISRTMIRLIRDEPLFWHSIAW